MVSFNRSRRLFGYTCAGCSGKLCFFPAISSLSSPFFRHMALLHGDYWWTIGTLLCEGKTIVLAVFPSLLCLIDGELRILC